MSIFSRRRFLQISVGLLGAKFILGKSYFVTVTKIRAPQDILQQQFYNHQSLYWKKVEQLTNQSKIIKRVSLIDDSQNNITTMTFWKDKKTYQENFVFFNKHFKSLGTKLEIELKELC